MGRNYGAGLPHVSTRKLGAQFHTWGSLIKEGTTPAQFKDPCISHHGMDLSYYHYQKWASKLCYLVSSLGFDISSTQVTIPEASWHRRAGTL